MDGPLQMKKQSKLSMLCACVCVWRRVCMCVCVRVCVAARVHMTHVAEGIKRS